MTGVAEQKELQNKLFLENAAAVAGTMAAAEAHARHCARMGADPDRAGRLWARGILLSIVAIFILG